jgi:hypothetical protein
MPIKTFAFHRMVKGEDLNHHETEVSPPATGPWVVEVAVAGTTMDAPFDRIHIWFNDEVLNFTIGDVTVSGPKGTITPLGLTKRIHEDNFPYYEINLSGLTGLVTYTLSIGPADILDNQYVSMEKEYQAILFDGSAFIAEARSPMILNAF